MSRLTTAEATRAAQECGWPITINTVRNIARERGLTERFGRRVYIRADGWMELIKGQPDCEPPYRVRQKQASA
jgi:hypothetical protein